MQPSPDNQEKPSVWNRIARAAGGTLIAGTVIIGFGAGIAAPRDFNDLNGGLDILVSGLLYTAVILAILVIYFLFEPYIKDLSR